MHATEYLKAPEKHETGPVVALYGSERYLKHAALAALVGQVLGASGGAEEQGDDELGLVRFNGKDADLKTVRDELSLVSMWGERRLVVVDDADEFVTKNRAGLESYLDKPAKKSVLVLNVKSWPKTTRLAKGVAKSGLDLECSELSGAALQRWIADVAKEKHAKQFERDAAALLVELAGSDLALLDQEIAKLASYAGERTKITSDDVTRLVGGWKAETTWAMTNAVRDGQIGDALACLDKLLYAGEAPQKLLGGINFVFRKFANATELTAEGVPLPGALQQAGVFPRDVGASSTYLRRIGRPRAEQISNWLLTADSNLKGGSRTADRLELEELLVKLSGKG